MNPPAQNVKTFYKGQNIFKEGQESNVAYMIRKGSVEIYKTVNNKKVVLARLKENEIFGEMGVISGGTRTANADALEFLEVVVLTEQLLAGLLRQCPKTIQYLMRLVISRLKKTGDMVQDKNFNNAFLSVCNLIDLLYKNHLSMPKERQQQIQSYKEGMNYNELSKKIRSILLIHQLDIDNIITKLYNLRLIEVFNTKEGGGSFAERYIRPANPDAFLDVAGSIHEEMKAEIFYPPTSEMLYIDIFDFAERVGSTPEIIYKKLAKGEIPESLFFLHKEHALAWAEKMGEAFFKKVAKTRKKIEELETVDDVVYVDNATLKAVFEKLGYYKLGVLMAVAEDEAKAKIRANLSGKIAKVVEEESQGRARVDEAELEDVQEELISLIKAAKGAAG